MAIVLRPPHDRAQPTDDLIGYRALYVDDDHNELKWGVTQQGTILGAVLRF